MRALPKRGKHLAVTFLGSKSGNRTCDADHEDSSHPRQCAQRATYGILPPFSRSPGLVYYLQVTMASFTTFVLCGFPPHSTSGCLGSQEILVNPFPRLQWINVPVVSQSSSVFHTEPTFGWKHQTTNLAEAIPRAQGACGSGGALIPTCPASSYSGNYILPPKSVPAAAVRCGLHFHLARWGLEVKSLRGGSRTREVALSTAGLHFGTCWARLWVLGFPELLLKSFGLKKLDTCKVLLSPNLFLSSTRVTVMRNPAHVPPSGSLVPARRRGCWNRSESLRGDRIGLDVYWSTRRDWKAALPATHETPPYLPTPTSTTTRQDWVPLPEMTNSQSYVSSHPFLVLPISQGGKWRQFPWAWESGQRAKDRAKPEQLQHSLCVWSDTGLNVASVTMGKIRKAGRTVSRGNPCFSGVINKPRDAALIFFWGGGNPTLYWYCSSFKIILNILF